MVIVSTSLVAVWAVIYFVWIYKRDTVYYGWGKKEEDYIQYQKKYYIFRELLYAVIVITAYAYFLCVCLRYSDLLKTQRSDEDKVDYLIDKKRRETANKYLDDKKLKFDKNLDENKPLLDKTSAERKEAEEKKKWTILSLSHD